MKRRGKEPLRLEDAMLASILCMSHFTVLNLYRKVTVVRIRHVYPQNPSFLLILHLPFVDAFSFVL
jgi:hypothetical protein